jgi:hypothetical protein
MVTRVHSNKKNKFIKKKILIFKNKKKNSKKKFKKKKKAEGAAPSPWGRPGHPKGWPAPSAFFFKKKNKYFYLFINKFIYFYYGGHVLPFYYGIPQGPTVQLSLK